MTDPVTQLTAEEKLLISLCRLEFSEEQKSEIRDLMNEIKDWDHFVKLINEHGVIALTAYNIRKIGLTDYVPVQAMKVLDNGRMQSLVRNAWLVQRWKEVNKILSETGIKHVLLKGMALEHTLYGAKGLRQMTDNDILVKKEDTLKAWLLLQNHGFVSDMIKSPLHRKIIIETGKHMPTLVKEGYAVEIHHRLFHEDEKNERLNEAIDNAAEIDVEGTRAFILNDDIHLDYLKEHLHYHQISGGSQLRLYFDMELIRPGSAPQFPDGFLANPNQPVSFEQRKNAYRNYFYSLPPRIRFRFLAGDIFPSLEWMKKRHGCGVVKAVLLYPRRLGKVLWLLKA
jgi:hypothetical protein